MGKVYGYCRTARAGNMEEQIELVSNYCKAKGLDLVTCFCDDGVSGHQMDRVEMKKLFEVIEQGDTIVTKNFARFTMNPIVQQMIIDYLDERRIKLLYADEQDPDDCGPAIRAWFEERWTRNTRDE